jgi:hypothetical protein
MNRDYKGLLVYFVEIVVFLFAAFGGFLKNIAPPEQSGAPYIVGILSFLALVVLLIVAAVARSAPGRRYRRKWIIAGMLAFAVALPASYFYSQSRSQYTWWYPPAEPVQRFRGLDTDFTPAVKDFLKNNKDNPQDRAAERLARNFDLDQIWTKESIEHAASRLTFLYAWLVMSLATAVFCLLEANSAASRSPKQPSKISGADRGKTIKEAKHNNKKQVQEDSTEASTEGEQ